MEYSKNVMKREAEKVDSFTLLFDQKVNVFAPGQTVTGRIDVQLNTEIKTKGVVLNVVGVARTKWTERELNSDDSASFTNYETEEEYVNKKVRLCGEDLGWSGDNPTLPVGHSSFPFEFTLPLNCPPSFEGGFWKGKSLGRIRYHCLARIARPWGFDHVVKEVFTVLPVQDLQLDPSAGVELKMEYNKTLTSCFCRTGTVFYQMAIPKRGFVPGESIPVTLTINNRSHRSIQAIHLQFVQCAIFSADRRDSKKIESLLPERGSRIDRRTICQIQEEINCAKFSTLTLQKQLSIPPVVSTFRDCAVIQVQYNVECKLFAKGVTTKMNAILPVNIGTVPVTNIIQDDSNHKNDQSPLLKNCQTSPPSPSYEDSFFGKVNARDDEENEFTFGDKEFAPKYPFFGNIQQ